MVFNCNLRDLKTKVNNAPQPLVLKSYVLGWIDKCLKDGIPKNKKEEKCISKDSKGSKSQAKEKKEPTEYNKFTGNCMKGCGKDNEPCSERMKECAIKWKNQK